MSCCLAVVTLEWWLRKLSRFLEVERHASRLFRKLCTWFLVSFILKNFKCCSVAHSPLILGCFRWAATCLPPERYLKLMKRKEMGDGRWRSALYQKGAKILALRLNNPVLH